MNLQRNPTTERFGVALLLILLMSSYFISVVHADVAIPGCNTATGIGNAAQLESDVAVLNGNGETDTIQLTAGCIYDLPTGLVIGPDGGKEITIEGNGAVISGNLSVRPILVQSGASLILKNVTVRDGVANNGGAIYNAGGRVILNGVAITNSAAPGGLGGGILNEVNGVLTLMDSVILGNSARWGGGIVNVGTLTMVGTTMSGNNHATENGGGLYNKGNALINRSTVSGNSAVGDGGGIYSFGTGAILNVQNSTISFNLAEDAGGVATTDTSNASITNSTFFGNDASSGVGGGLFISSNAAVTMLNSTIAENSAVSGGGVIVGASATLNLQNSILANSVAGSDCRNFGSLVAAGGNLIEDGSCVVTGALNVDPSFSGLTGTPAYFALATGSPAIDAGANSICPTTDQRQAARPADGNGDGIASCDLGAYEADAIPLDAVELITNGSFEVDTNSDAVPDDWTLKAKTGDKGLCDAAFAQAGQCSFRFKGSAAETAQLVQNVLLPEARGPLVAGDVLRLSAHVMAPNPTANLKLVLSVTYAGNPTPVQSSITVRHQPVYTQATVDDIIIGTGAVTGIKVMLKHKSKAGKLYADSISLLWASASAPRDAAPLPLPAAPDTFRGNN